MLHERTPVTVLHMLAHRGTVRSTAFDWLRGHASPWLPWRLHCTACCKGLSGAVGCCRGLAQRWRMPLEMALDLAVLGLYDIFIYAGGFGTDGMPVRTASHLLQPSPALSLCCDPHRNCVVVHNGMELDLPLC